MSYQDTNNNAEWGTDWVSSPFDSGNLSRNALSYQNMTNAPNASAHLVGSNTNGNGGSGHWPGDAPYDDGINDSAPHNAYMWSDHGFMTPDDQRRFPYSHDAVGYGRVVPGMPRTTSPELFDLEKGEARIRPARDKNSKHRESTDMASRSRGHEKPTKRKNDSTYSNLSMDAIQGSDPDTSSDNERHQSKPKGRNKKSRGLKRFLAEQSPWTGLDIGAGRQ
ncbi:hypothetical protein PG990_012815 [Apiospora arundinis]